MEMADLFLLTVLYHHFRKLFIVSQNQGFGVVVVLSRLRLRVLSETPLLRCQVWAHGSGAGTKVGSGRAFGTPERDAAGLMPCSECQNASECLVLKGYTAGLNAGL